MYRPRYSLAEMMQKNAAKASLAKSTSKLKIKTKSNINIDASKNTVSKDAVQAATEKSINEARIASKSGPRIDNALIARSLTKSTGIKFPGKEVKINSKANPKPPIATNFNGDGTLGPSVGVAGSRINENVAIPKQQPSTNVKTPQLNNDQGSKMQVRPAVEEANGKAVVRQTYEKAEPVTKVSSVLHFYNDFDWVNEDILEKNAGIITGTRDLIKNVAVDVYHHKINNNLNYTDKINNNLNYTDKIIRKNGIKTPVNNDIYHKTVNTPTTVKRNFKKAIAYGGLGVATAKVLNNPTPIINGAINIYDHITRPKGPNPLVVGGAALGIGAAGYAGYRMLRSPQQQQQQPQYPQYPQYPQQ